jgi:hypothetical protein
MSWRRILLWSALLLVIVVAATIGFLHHTGAATEVLRRELQAVFAAPVGLDGSDLDVANGRLTVRGLRLGDPRLTTRDLLHVEELQADVQANPLAGLGIERVVATGVRIEAGPSWPSPADVLRPRPTSAAGSAPPRLPALELRRGSVVLHVAEGQPPLELFDLELATAGLAGADGLSLRGTARLRDPAITLEVGGEYERTSGAFHVTLSTAPFDVDEATTRRLARLCGAELPDLAAAAAVRRLTLTCRSGAPGSASPVVAEVVAEFANLRVAGGDLPSVVRQATVTVAATTAGAGTAQVRLHQEGQDGVIDVEARASDLAGELQLDVRVRGRDVAIGEDALSALRMFPVGRNIVRALQPTNGRADVDLFLGNPQRRGGRADLDLSLRGVEMSFAGFGKDDGRVGFPLPMVQASGRVRLRGDGGALEEITAAIAPSAGGGAVQLHGRIDGNAPSGDDVTLDIAAENVAFNQALRAALATLLRDGGALYDKFSPSGRTQVRVHVRPRSELRQGFRVDIEPTGASMQWAGFPYRLDDLRGSIVVLAEGARFDITGRHGTGSLTMRGRIPLETAGPGARGFEAAFDLADVTIDDDLQRALHVLAPDLDDAWRRAAPRGRLGGHVKVWRPEPTDPLFHDARIDLVAVDLALPASPWRATGLDGEVLVQGSDESTRIDFDALRGVLDNGTTKAQLAVLGHIDASGTPGHDLAFVVRDLEVDDRIGTTLDELGALDLATWQSLRPSGKVDLVCRHDRNADGSAPDRGDRMQVVVQLLDVRSAAPMLPRVAEQMTGELRIQDGELTFDDVRARLGDAQVQCWDGRVRRLAEPDGRTEIRFAVRAADFPVDDGLANLFSGPLHRAVLERQLRGRADIDGLRLTFTVPAAGSAQPFTTTIQGQLALDDVDMLLGSGQDGLAVQGIRGVVQLQPSAISDAGGQIRGQLRGGSLGVFGQNFEAIETAFVADAERLALETLVARCHGGALSNARADAPALTYLLPGEAHPEGRLSGEVQFERIDVFSLLTAAGWVNPPYSGTASGRMLLRRLDGNDVVAAEGEGTLKVERADLGAVPLFTAIYAQLPPSDRPRFNHLDVTCRLAEQRVQFERLEVRSDILAAKGTGHLDLDGYLDVRMTLDNLLGSSADPFVMPLIDYLAQNIVRFHLFGHLRDLRAEKRWITESSPGRRPIVPMPPELPKRVVPAY